VNVESNWDQQRNQTEMTKSVKDTLAEVPPTKPKLYISKKLSSDPPKIDKRLPFEQEIMREIGYGEHAKE
jgi:hypothetical protein